MENQLQSAPQQHKGASSHPLSHAEGGATQSPPAFQLKAGNGNPVQLARSETRNKITYNTQDFKNGSETKNRERVSSVVITGLGAKDDTPPNEPISFMNNDTGKWDDMDGWHKGHVAARAIGGSYASWNMVPMLPNFNCGAAWKAEESAIADLLSQGKTVTITPNYNSTSDPRVPNSITVTAAGHNKTLAHAVPVVPATTDKDNAWINDFAKKGGKKHALQQLAIAHQKGWIPDNYLSSPYLPLDIAWLNGGGPGNPGTRFTYQSWQTDWLIRYNKRLNGGAMESDSWDASGAHVYRDPHQVLLEAGRKNRPEADHIVPNSYGGANFFVNARLVSWELNNSIQRVASASAKFMKW